MYSPANSPLKINKGPLATFIGWLVIAASAGFFIGAHFGGHIK